MNRDYSVCPSYPPAVIVPSSIGDDVLIKAAKFRQGGRFPVLCYYHRKNGMVRFCVSANGSPTTRPYQLNPNGSGDRAQQSAAHRSQQEALQ